MNITKLKEIKQECKKLVTDDLHLKLDVYKDLIKRVLLHGGTNHMTLDSLKDYYDDVILPTFKTRGNVDVNDRRGSTSEMSKDKYIIIELMGIIDEACDLEV